jgi:hypothetical protein
MSEGGKRSMIDLLYVAMTDPGLNAYSSYRFSVHCLGAYDSIFLFQFSYTAL